MKMSWFTKRQYEHGVHFFLTTIAESFIALLPYTLLFSIIILLTQIINHYGIRLDWYSYVPASMGIIFPTLLLISTAFHFAKKLNINHVIVISLSLSIFVTVEVILHQPENSDEFAAFNWSKLSLLVLLIPISTVFFIRKIHLMKNTILFSDYNSTYVDKMFHYIPAFILVYFSSVLFYSIATHHIVTTVTNFSFDEAVSPDILMLSGSIISHLLWTVGIHGANTVEMVIGSAYMAQEIFDGLSYKLFYDLFILMGGSGIGLALILAIFIVGRDRHSQRVARLASPLAIFNINEVLIYGLPIVLNKQLILPFILAPTVNIILAYSVLSFYAIDISNTSIPWTTPIFFNAYLVSDNYIPIMLLQGLLLFSGTMIYIPFVKRYTLSQSTSQHRSYLAEGLEVAALLQGQEGEASEKAQSVIIDTNRKVEEAISLINSGQLLMYYQPKVNAKTQECQQYEALLRLQKADGKIIGPYFLGALETGGLSDIIDLWVCQAVRKDMDDFYEQGFYPKISVNLHPDTISKQSTVEQVCAILEGYNVEIEVTEHSSLNTKETYQNILFLKEKGFELSMDDFGSGYSSIENFITLPISVAKFDKSLIDNLEDPNGYAVVKHISELCIDIDCHSVAEGVETQQQYEVIKEMGIDLVQGYYFSKPLSVKDTLQYNRRHNLHPADPLQPILHS